MRSHRIISHQPSGIRIQREDENRVLVTKNEPPQDRSPPRRQGHHSPHRRNAPRRQGPLPEHPPLRRQGASSFSSSPRGCAPPPTPYTAGAGATPRPPTLHATPRAPYYATTATSEPAVFNGERFGARYTTINNVEEEEDNDDDNEKDEKDEEEEDGDDVRR